MAERTKPKPSETTDQSALSWLKEQHEAPCDDPNCDSVYCYIAERIASLPRDHERFVRCSQELVEQMRAEPSRPVTIAIQERERGELWFIATEHLPSPDDIKAAVSDFLTTGDLAAIYSAFGHKRSGRHAPNGGEK